MEFYLVKKNKTRFLVKYIFSSHFFEECDQISNGGRFYAVDISKRVSWAEVCNSFILEGFQIGMK